MKRIHMAGHGSCKKKLGFEKFFVKSTRWKEAAHRTIEGNKSDQIRASATKKAKAVVIDRIPDSKKDIVEKVRKEMNHEIKMRFTGPHGFCLQLTS